MREIRLSGSMSGMWKRSTAGLVRHRQTKGPATDRPNLNHRATSRLYLTLFTLHEGTRSFFIVAALAEAKRLRFSGMRQGPRWPLTPGNHEVVRTTLTCAGSPESWR